MSVSDAAVARGSDAICTHIEGESDVAVSPSGLWVVWPQVAGPQLQCLQLAAGAQEADCELAALHTTALRMTAILGALACCYIDRRTRLFVLVLVLELPQVVLHRQAHAPISSHAFSIYSLLCSPPRLRVLGAP